MLAPRRTYYFDRHVSDVVLRLLLLALLGPCLAVSWFCWARFELALEGIFGRNIEISSMQLFYKRDNKTGFSQQTLFRQVDADRLADGKGVLSYPDYLKKYVDSQDPDFLAFKIMLILHKAAMYLVAGTFTALSLFLGYLLAVSYGGGGYASRFHRWIFQFFNTDFHAVSPEADVSALPLDLKLVFDVCMVRALTSSTGEFLFVDREFHRYLHPKDEASDAALRLTRRAFRRLTERIHRFSFVRGAVKIQREFCLVAPVAGKVTEVEDEIDGVKGQAFKAGVFAVHPRLYAALAPRYRCMEKLDPALWGIDLTGHRFAYPIYLVLLYYRVAIERGDHRELHQEGRLALPLVRLVEEAGLAVPADGLRDFLADLHADLGWLVSKGHVEDWVVRDRGIPLARDWYESVKSFAFDPDRHEYKTATDVLADKIYFFSVGLPSWPQLPSSEVKRLPAETTQTGHPLSVAAEPAPTATPAPTAQPEPAAVATAPVPTPEAPAGGTPPAA